MTAKIFQTFRDLRDDLGKIDASFAYIALSLKYLDYSASQSANRLNFLEEVAERHSIRVLLQNDDDPQKNIYFSATVAVHSEWDRFLYGLMDELSNFNYNPIDKGRRRDGESRLAFFLRSMKVIAPGKLDELPQPLIDLCEYLRLLRNYYAHRLTTPQRECVELFNKIRKKDNIWPSKFGNLKFSTECCQPAFDDVLILTITVKLLAEEICTRLAPDPDILLEHPATKDFIAREKSPMPESRFQLFLNDRFGLDRITANQLSKKLVNKALV